MKARIEKAMEKYEKKQNPKKRKTKNKKPEAEVQEKVCKWLKENNFSFNVVEAKSTFSAKAGRYISQSVAPGVCDIIGVNPNGTGCFIELKAPGKLKTLRPSQFLYLEEKISMNCFAVVVDSVVLLERLYHLWLNAETASSRRDILNQYLLPLKPSKMIDDGSQLFD